MKFHEFVARFFLGGHFLLKQSFEVLNLPAAAFAGSYAVLHTTWPETNLHCIVDSVLQGSLARKIKQN